MNSKRARVLYDKAGKSIEEAKTSDDVTLLGKAIGDTKTYLDDIYYKQQFLKEFGPAAFIEEFGKDELGLLELLLEEDEEPEEP